MPLETVTPLVLLVCFIVLCPIWAWALTKYINAYTTREPDRNTAQDD